MKKIMIRTIWILIDFIVSFKKKNFFRYLNSGKSLNFEVYVYKLSFLSCVSATQPVFSTDGILSNTRKRKMTRTNWFFLWALVIENISSWYKVFLYPILYLYWISFTRKFQNKILKWRWFKDFFFWDSIYINTLFIELIIIEIILLFYSISNFYN